MILDFVFIIIIIALALMLEIRTHQKKRVIIVSSGFFVLVLYFVLFDLFKDQQILLLLVKFRPDLIIESFAPTILKIFSTNPFQGSYFLIKILNVAGIKEGTRLFTLITSYRPSASVSPFSGISFGLVFDFLKNVVNDFFGWTSYIDYCSNIKKLAYIFVLIILDEVHKVPFVLFKDNYKFKSDLLIA